MNELFNLKLEQIMKDADQYAAFNAKGSTVVKAGPGSGKTTVLTLKIVDLLKEKIKAPRGLACVTYSNEAVKEFTNRLRKLGLQKRKNVVLSTVHSFCISEILIPFGEMYIEGFSLPLRIIQNADKNRMFKNVLKDLNIEEDQLSVTEMDKERNQSIGQDSTVIVESFDIAKKVAIDYEKRLSDTGKVDFIDIVRMSTKIIKEQPYVRKCLEAKFPWILIDEYQDLGRPLHEMILTFYTTTNIKIFAVGDPDQSIYGFQGAIPDYLLEIYDNPNINSITLKTNYRSNQDIIDLSTIVLNIDDREYKAGTRHGEKAEISFVTCEAEMEEQYDYVINEIIPKCIEQEIPYDEICILAGKGSELKELANKMEENHIPYYFSKYDFLKSNVVLWLKDCASWIVGDPDVEFGELNDFLQGLMTDVTDEKIIKETKSLFQTLTVSKKFQHNLCKWVIFLVNELSLKEKLEKSNKNNGDIEIFNKFITKTIYGELKEYNIQQFSLLGNANDQVTLSTRHSSKGLEFEVVIMLGLEEGNFPNFRNVNDDKKLNEERRVFFVSITRAKRVCYLLRSKRITYHTKKGIYTFNKEPSMFWEELLEAYNFKQEQNQK
ncbi:ATP-dependent helicase [Radiobacillus sp. PE A8.2]|uniref:ATP-dependent helicase n=1 Tax=Radiobacillus sp. PE A8.2 TaxID=3380349 RepID=UPI00388DDF0F